MIWATESLICLSLLDQDRVHIQLKGLVWFCLFVFFFNNKNKSNLDVNLICRGNYMSQTKYTTAYLRQSFSFTRPTS